MTEGEARGLAIRVAELFEREDRDRAGRMSPQRWAFRRMARWLRGNTIRFAYWIMDDSAAATAMEEAGEP